MVSTRSKPANQTVLEDFVDEPKSNESAHTHQGKRKPDATAQESEHEDKKIKTEDKTSHDEHREPDENNTAEDKDDKGRDESVKDEKDSTESKDKEGTETKKDVSSEDDKKQPVVGLKKSDDTETYHSEPIKINRAPVLDLFASCAAQFEHPTLPWTQCLSLGSAVASICALSKGRAIGQIPASNKDESTRNDGEEHVSVMGFNVVVKEGVAYVGETKKTANESYLKGRFGARYDEVRKTMVDALQSWKGHEEEFARKGFHMYEKFRPGNGQWGQVGGLHVEDVERAITRP